MNRTVATASIAATLLTGIASATITAPAQAATVFYQTGASGSGTQNFFSTNNPISGKMTAPVPRFNGALGTLVQADFEFAGSATGTWLSTVAKQTGSSTLSLSGPADVDGQPMGTLSVGFVDPYDDITGSNSFNAQYVNLTVTSGAFFNSLTGVGTYDMNWLFAGNSTLDTPAIGTGPSNEGFSWGGSVHVLYTYEAVPEPATWVSAVCGAAMLLSPWVRRRRLARRAHGPLSTT